MNNVFAICFIALMLAIGTNVSAQEDEVPSTAAYLELEGGLAMFQSSSLRRDFPIGLQLAFGTELATGRDLRVRLRPQVGVRFFSQPVEEDTNKHFRIFRLGMTFGYDTYFVGQTTFFPYLTLNYNWVNQYDAETIGYDSEGRATVVYSDSDIKGNGVSTELGLKIQYQRFYVKGGFDIFRPVLRVRYTEEVERIESDDRLSIVLQTRHQRETFNLNAFSLSIGYVLF